MCRPGRLHVTMETIAWLTTRAMMCMAWERRNTSCKSNTARMCGLFASLRREGQRKIEAEHTLDRLIVHYVAAELHTCTRASDFVSCWPPNINRLIVLVAAE